MAQNSIGYEGRVVIKDETRAKVVTQAGDMVILNLQLAEQHSMKLGRAKKDPAMKKYVDDERNIGKADGDYINTTTSWHKLTVFGDKAAALAQNPEFNHGALIIVDNASYTEEGDWETKDGVKRAGRPETIGEMKGEIEIKFPAREENQGALWDGISELPKPGGSGGGQGREYGDNEGF